MSAAAPMTPPAQQQMDPMWQQEEDEQAADEWVRQILARAPPPSLQQQRWAAEWAKQQRTGIIDLDDTDGDRERDLGDSGNTPKWNRVLACSQQVFQLVSYSSPFGVRMW